MDAITTIMLPVLGLVTSVLFGLFRKASSWVNAQSAIIKQVLVTVVAAVVYAVAKYIGADVPSTWTDGTIQTFITALLAFGFYAIKEALVKHKTAPRT